nr:MAG TPA: hypothetical protein [Caudoviricetes sp.]
MRFTKELINFQLLARLHEVSKKEERWEKRRCTNAKNKHA